MIGIKGIGNFGIGSKGIAPSGGNPILGADPDFYFAPRLSTITYGTGAKVANYENLGALGASYDYTQASEVNQPSILTAELNGLDMLKFVSGTFFDTVSNVTRDLLVDTDLKSMTSITVFKQDTNTSSGAYIYEWIATGGIEGVKLALYNNGTRTLVQIGNQTAGSGRIISNTAPTDRNTKYYIFVLRRNGNALSGKWYNNGLQLTMPETSLTDTVGTGNAKMRQDPIGIIGDHAIWNRALTDNEISAIVEYLETTYGFK
jgi:hypothetical protein